MKKNHAYQTFQKRFYGNFMIIMFNLHRASIFEESTASHLHVIVANLYLMVSRHTLPTHRQQ